MPAKLQVLILEDRVDDAKLIERALRSGAVECEARRVETLEAFTATLRGGGADVVLADFRLPDVDGVAVLRIAKEVAPDTPLIIVSGSLTDESAVALLREGAVDFVLKDRMSRLGPAVQRAAEDARRRAAARRADEDLRASELRFRTLASVAPVGIFCTDAQGACTYVNDRWCEMAGMTEERARGSGWLMGIHPDDRARVAAAWSRSVKAGAAFEGEYRYVGSGRGPVWVIGRGVPQADDGNPVGYVGVVTDITERKSAEQALQEQLDELRRFQEATVDRELHMEELKRAIERLEEQVARLKRGAG